MTIGPQQVGRSAFALLLAINVCSSHAAATSAEAFGKVLTTGVGERHDSPTGEAAQAQFDYTYPSMSSAWGASLKGAAQAQAGTLKAQARLAVTLVPATPNIYTYQSWATATFTDTWVFDDQPLDTPGTLRVGLHLSGSAGSTHSANTLSTTQGAIDFSLGSLTVNQDVVDSERHYQTVENSTLNDDIVLEVNFLYGRPILVRGWLSASVEFRSLNGDGITGVGEADFGNTAAFTTLQVLDGKTGLYTDAYSLHTESPTAYIFQSTVPEPSAAWLALGGLALCGVVRRRGAPRSAAH